MLNAQEIQGHWDGIKGKLKERWGQLTDDDLQIVAGNIDQLIGRIEQRTGEAREGIERFIDQALQHPTTQRVMERANEFARSASESVREGMDHVRDGMDEARGQIKEGFSRAQDFVHDRPGQSVATLFGIGVVAGVITGLLLHSDR